MVKLRIGLDLDGVCANFMKGIDELLSRLKIPHRVIETNEDILSWSLQDNFNISSKEEEQVWNFIKKSKLFWLNLNLLDVKGWNLLIKKLANREDVELFFITARQKGKNLREQTFKWLQLQGIKYPTLIFSEDKIALIEALKLDYFLEDNPKFFKECQEKAMLNLEIGYRSYECKAFKYNYPYNSHIEKDLKVNSLKEFVENILVYEEKLLNLIN